MNNAGAAPIEWSWVDFSLGEDVRDDARLMQDDAWKHAISDGRAHISHREYSSKHRDEMKAAIRDYQAVNLVMNIFVCHRGKKLSLDLVRHIIGFSHQAQGKLLLPISIEQKNYNLGDQSRHPFRICLRCRPMLDCEEIKEAYNCIDTMPIDDKAVLHEGKLARNGRRLTMTHRDYYLDRVWDQSTSNETVCSDEVEPLVRWAEQGNSSSLLCFGQTGTGKVVRK
jgi:hypothetical protein